MGLNNYGSEQPHWLTSRRGPAAPAGSSTASATVPGLTTMITSLPGGAPPPPGPPEKCLRSACWH
eukprot:9833407-Alexandrium_andersonii.AAC.1